MELNVLSLNIHKGFAPGYRRFVLPTLREAIRATGADLVFLQEVIGRHDRHAARVAEWPDASQMEYLADEVWSSFAYGRNAVYQSGHHGNAILSRFIIEDSRNHDLSSSRLEQRGVLHARIRIDGCPVHCLCLHLSLRERDRRVQLARVGAIVRSVADAAEPLILAGDFNDWRRRAGAALAAPVIESSVPLEAGTPAHEARPPALGLREVFREKLGREPATFPSVLPLLSLDRIFVRGFDVREVRVLGGTPWNRLSDHLGLWAKLSGPAGTSEPSGVDAPRSRR